MNFAGGLNALASPWGVGKTEILRASNVMMNEPGSLQTRPGLYPSGANAPANAEHLAWLNVPMLGKLFGISQIGGTTNKLYEITNPPIAWTELGTFSASGRTPVILNFSPLLIASCGYEVPKSWDGATFAALTATAGQTVPPGAQHLISHLSQLWVWNTNATQTTLDGPSSLRASAVSNANSWPNANQTFIAPGDGTQGQGLAVFTVAEVGIAPDSFLVAFKDASTYLVRSTFGASDFAVTQAKTNLGCVAPRSIQFLPGLGIMRLSHRGFALFDGINDRIVSEQIRPYLFGKGTPGTVGEAPVLDDITGTNMFTLGTAISVVMSYPPFYLCACPMIGSPGNVRIFAYDLVLNQWTVWQVASPLRSTGATMLYEVLFGEGGLPSTARGIYMGFARTSASAYDIEAYNLNPRQTYDLNSQSGISPIACSVRFVPVATGSPLRRGYHRRMLAKIYRVSQGQYMTATIAIGPAQQVAYGSVTPQTVIAATALVSAGPSTDIAQTQLSQAMEEDLLFDINRSGEVQYIELAWSGSMTLRGTEWHTMPKAFGRPMHV